MTTAGSVVLDAVAGVVPPLLDALTRAAWVQRHLYPPLAPKLAEALAPHAEALARPLAGLEAVDCPSDLAFLRDRLAGVARDTIAMVHAFGEAAKSEEDVIGLYRALRRMSAVQEALYPLSPVLEPVSRFFLEPARRDDADFVRRLRDAALREDGAKTGVLHADNERGARGGFSLYVPEAFGTAPMPLIVALHGGSGHGRDFLWAWLAEARSREMLVLSPTARDRTWSIMGGQDVDAEPIAGMVELVAERYPVDRERILLTGMSDGGTYTLLCGLQDDMPFTHLAPACGVLHPFLFAENGITRARDWPVYWISGALDWMFPVQAARMAEQTLEAVGARVTYREIEDLSHTYPRDENPAILDWVMATPPAPRAA